MADHFDLYLILFAPLIVIFGSYTLIIVQLLAILLGGWGIFKYIDVRFQSPKTALAAMLFFYSFFGTLNAVAVAYHSSVVAASMVPWLFYFVHRRKFIHASLMLVFILIAKENMGFWMFFIASGCIIEYRKNKNITYFLIGAACFSAVYFYSVLHWAMPAFSNGKQSYQLSYSVLGSDLSAIILNIIESPVDTFKLLYTSHVESTYASKVKQTLHFTLLCSGLPLLILRPHFLWMLIPIYFQKLFHDDFLKWSIGFHYNIEFGTIMALGLFSIAGGMRTRIKKNALSILLVLLSIGTTISIMDNGDIFMKRSQLRFYKADHYKRIYNVKRAHEALKLIPEEAIVCAQPSFVPHLALRDKIYNFPFIQDAEYIVYSLLEDENPFIEGKEMFISITDSLKNTAQWEVIYEEQLTILKKKK